ncbi:MAG: hypothetical protein ABL927_14925, partial [Bdellovibrionales bacterium]
SYLTDRLQGFPKVLLEPLDLSEAKRLARYKTINGSAGYCKDLYVNDAVYAKSAAYIPIQPEGTGFTI